MIETFSPYLNILRDRINLKDVPFTERGSRLVIYQEENHFSIRLTERWYKRDRQLSSYRTRLPIVDELQFSGEDGTPLKFNITTFPHLVICQTAQGDFKITFEDLETLLFSLPQQTSRISFLARVSNAQLDRRGGILRLTGDIRRTIAFTTNARILENRVDDLGSDTYRVTLQLEPAPESTFDPVLKLNITPRLGFNRYISDPRLVIETAARHWHEWFASAPPVASEYERQYYFAWWVMRAGLISPRYFTTREALTPSKMYYVGVWQWDAYFHALAYRHVDMRLAHDQLRIQLDHQSGNGMIPDAIHDEGLVTHLTFPIEADVTKPPLVAWTAWKLFQHQPDLEFLKEIYEPVMRLNHWWFEYNDLDQNGLCEYQHPFSSGLDDSPLWDEGMPVESPDLNTYLYLQQESLARIASAIGEHKEAEMWAARAEQLLANMVNQSWDPVAGLFWARKEGLPLPVQTPFNLFPLITGHLPGSIANRLVQHLTNPKKFWTKYPVPTVSIDDPKYFPEQMWRGPTWVNINYLLIEGLNRSGFPDLALELQNRTLALMNQDKGMHEYYHPETGMNPPKAAPIFGWSSAIFIELAIHASHKNLPGEIPSHL